MNKVIGFGLGLILMVTAGAQTSDSSTSPTLNSWTKERAVEYICETLQKDCSALIEARHYPQIILTEINALGLYVSAVPDVIFINQNITEDVIIKQAMVHELVHFLDYHYRWTNFEPCDTEALAFYVMNKWASENGGFIDEGWEISYGCI